MANIIYNQNISHHTHTLVNTFEFAYHHHNLYEISPSYQNDNYIFLWLIQTARDWGRDRERETMGFDIMLCTVHTTQGQAQGAIVFYCGHPGPGVTCSNRPPH